MISPDYANKAMRLVINELRLLNHPAKSREVIEFWHGQVRGIVKVLPISAEVVSAALAEVDALRTDKPAKPYERMTNKVAEPV